MRKTQYLSLTIIFAALSMQAQATTYDRSFTGFISQGQPSSQDIGATHYDQWYLALESFTPFSVLNGDTINATITLDQSLTIPASVELTSFTFLLGGSSFPAGDTGVSGTTTLFNLGGQVATTTTGTGTSSQLANGAVFFPPNNGPITFDSLTSNFIITTLSQPATIDNAAISYTLFSPNAAVPEPEEWAMLLMGLPLVSWVTRRKQVCKTAKI